MAYIDRPAALGNPAFPIEHARALRGAAAWTAEDEEFYRENDLVFVNDDGVVVRATAQGAVTQRLYLAGQSYGVMGQLFPAMATEMRGDEHPMLARGVPLNVIPEGVEFHAGFRYVANTSSPVYGGDYELNDAGRDFVATRPLATLVFDADADRLTHYILGAATTAFEPNVQITGWFNNRPEEQGGLQDGDLNPRVTFRFLPEFLGK